jgi:hypothetical protein
MPYQEANHSLLSSSCSIKFYEWLQWHDALAMHIGIKNSFDSQ